jgi:hypothetical protein
MDIAGIIGAAVSVITLIILGVKGVFSIDKRLAVCENKLDPFTLNWHNILENRLTKLESRNLITEVIAELSKVTPHGNPIDPNRYQYLLKQMQSNALTQPEARELESALIELKQEAENNKNVSTLLAIALALIVLGALLNNK